MHIRVLMLVVLPKHIEHRSRFLRRGRIVEIDQRMAVCLLAEDREILADSLPIGGASGNLVHKLICSTRSCAPVYSQPKIDNSLARRQRFAGTIPCRSQQERIFKLDAQPNLKTVSSK